MAAYRLTELAQHDLEEIWNYIAADFHGWEAPERGILYV